MAIGSRALPATGTGSETRPPIQRRSVRERLAERSATQTPLADCDPIPFSDETGGTGTFRVDETGQLVTDTAASLGADHDPDRSLGRLGATLAANYHLLVLPPAALSAELEALAVSVWDEAGWSGPGVLHLTQGVTLEGPWEAPAEWARHPGTDQPPADARYWLLRCPADRGNPPTEQIMQLNDWARAFPTGMPVGLEFETLLALRRIATRLDGAVRVAGTEQMLAGEQQSDTNLRTFSEYYLSARSMKALLLDAFGEVDVLETPDTSTGAARPYAMTVPTESRGRVLVGVRPADLLPASLRWEPWDAEDHYLYEILWADQFDFVLPSGQMGRAGRQARRAVARAAAKVAVALDNELPHAVTVDGGDFPLHPDELRLRAAEPHPAPADQQPNHQ